MPIAGPSRMARRPALVALACLAGMVLLLSGCMIISGGRNSSDTLPDGGNISATFVGADGSTEQTLDTGAVRATLNAIVIVRAERGELQVELLNADGSVAFAVKARPDESISRSGSVLTDQQGRLRYRVRATGARNGSYQVLYQRTPAGG